MSPIGDGEETVVVYESVKFIVKAKDGTVVSIPSDFFRADGLRRYLESVTDETFSVVRAQE